MDGWCENCSITWAVPHHCSNTECWQMSSQHLHVHRVGLQFLRFSRSDHRHKAVFLTSLEALRNSGIATTGVPRESCADLILCGVVCTPHLASPRTLYGMLELVL